MMRRFFASTIKGEQSDGNLAYGFSVARRVNPAYSGNHLIVLRHDDDVAQPFNFNESGELNQSSISTFLGSSIGSVQRLYNQGFHNEVDYVEQTDKTLQPIIYNGSSFFIENGKPYIDFSGTDIKLKKRYTTSTDHIVDQESFSSSILKTQNSSTLEVVWNVVIDDSGNRVNMYTDTRANRLMFMYRPVSTQHTFNLNVTATQGEVRQYSHNRNSSGLIKGFYNGSEQGNVTSTEVFGSFSFMDFIIGALRPVPATQNFSSIWSETLIYREFNETKQSTVESEQRTFYGL